MKIEYEKNVFYREKKKTRFGFQKAFFQNIHLEKRGSSYNQGRLIFGSIRYIYIYIIKILHYIINYYFLLLSIKILIIYIYILHLNNFIHLKI